MTVDDVLSVVKGYLFNEEGEMDKQRLVLADMMEQRGFVDEARKLRGKEHSIYYVSIDEDQRHFTSAKKVRDYVRKNVVKFDMVNQPEVKGFVLGFGHGQSVVLDSLNFDEDGYLYINYAHSLEELIERVVIDFQDELEETDE